MSKHTPEPWKVYSDGTKTFVASSSAGRVIAVGLYDENTDTPIDEVDANARLIAAAPELLSAAESAVEIIRDNYGQDRVDIPCDCQAVNVLERAITQARGKEKS